MDFIIIGLFIIFFSYILLHSLYFTIFKSSTIEGLDPVSGASDADADATTDATTVDTTTGADTKADKAKAAAAAAAKKKAAKKKAAQEASATVKAEKGSKMNDSTNSKVESSRRPGATFAVATGGMVSTNP